MTIGARLVAREERFGGGEPAAATWEVSAISHPPARDATTAPVAEIGYPQVVAAFSAVARALTEKIELDDLLHLVAEKVCWLLNIRRCSVYLKDPVTGLYRGQVAETGADVDAAIKRLTVGIEADGFTREILMTMKPVLIRNAQADPRPVRSTMIEWGVQAMLGVPMVLEGDVIGLLFLDNAHEPHEYTPEEQTLSATFANLAAIAISQAQLTADLRRTLTTVEQQNKVLRRAAAIEDRLTLLVLDGAHLGEIAAAVTDLTGKPCAIHDAEYRRRAHASPEGDPIIPRLLDPAALKHEAVRAAISSLTPRRPSVIGPIPAAGIQHRFLVSPIKVGDDHWGYLVLMEYGTRLGAKDMIVARRTATIIALELSAERRAAEAHSHAIEALTRDLIHSSDEPSALARRADYHGLGLGDPHVVCLFSPRDDASVARLSTRRVAQVLEEVAPEMPAFVAGVDKGATAVLELPEGASTFDAVRAAKTIAAAAASRLAPDGSVTAALSTVCRATDDYPGAYEQARQVSRCISTFGAPGEAQVLAADDLGAGRLLLATAERAEADRFVGDTLGPLLAGDAAAHDLLLTLQAFFQASRSVRRSAALLDVHENTIRYRLARIGEMTGLDIMSDGDDQLAVQLALLILRLEGRLPNVFGDVAVEPSNGRG